MAADTTPIDQHRPCGLGRRLLAMAYDAVIVTGLMFLAAALALPFGTSGRQAFADPWLSAYLASVWFLYETWCWRKAGMTLGMRAWRVLLVTESGGALTWSGSLLRFLVSCLSLGAFGAGFLWSLVDRHGRSWHDLAAGTRLVVVGRNSN